jgi:hypothetical protein
VNAYGQTASEAGCSEPPLKAKCSRRINYVGHIKQPKFNEIVGWYIVTVNGTEYHDVFAADFAIARSDEQQINTEHRNSYFLKPRFASEPATVNTRIIRG